MNFWIFKFNPDKYRLQDRLADPETKTTWRVRKLHDQIAPGDRVFVWQTGKERGIRATLRVDSLPSQMREMENEQQYLVKRDTDVCCRVLATIEHRNINLSHTELKSTPGLENLSVFQKKVFQEGTNFHVTHEQGKILLKLIKRAIFKKRVDRPSLGRKKTADVAKNISGTSLYQQRAQLALPILVRQVAEQRTVTYGELAQELGLPNPRNLNYVLGSIGITLVELSKKWNKEIPPIECIVVNKTTRLPGKGVDQFLTDGIAIKSLNHKQKQALVAAALAKIFTYPKWNTVLQELGLKPAHPALRVQVTAARSGGGGESEAHLLMKRFVALNPSAVGLSLDSGPGENEFLLPSGDSLDVLFQRKSVWIAVEVKSRVSPEHDIARGLFQCVKYRAVLEAWRGYEGEFGEVRVILALETNLPSKLVGLRNALGVEVMENVRIVGARG